MVKMVFFDRNGEDVLENQEWVICPVCGNKTRNRIREDAAITELDETVLNRLINRIVIGKPEKIDGVRTQEVRIIYNFVGEL